MLRVLWGLNLWVGPGGSTWAGSEEGEQEVPGHGGDPRLLSPEPTLRLATQCLPHAFTGPHENAPSQAGGENISAPGWASWIWLTWSCAHLLDLLGELMSLCV